MSFVQSVVPTILTYINNPTPKSLTDLNSFIKLYQDSNDKDDSFIENYLLKNHPTYTYTTTNGIHLRKGNGGSHRRRHTKRTTNRKLRKSLIRRRR